MSKILTVLSILGLIVVCSSVGVAQVLWGTGSPDWGSGASGPSPVIGQFNTASGTIIKSYSFSGNNWMWISGLADSGRFLYASHNTYNINPSSSMDTHDFKIAKIDRYTGAVLSDVSIAGYLGQTWSQVNALDFHSGNLYGVENLSWPDPNPYRGYAMEITLNAAGDVIGAARGAFVGPYPDCGLDFYDGLWYATSWGYSGPPKMEGSIVYTSPDIMNTPFIQVGSGATPGVKGIGMIDGWEFDKTGRLFAVTWYPAPFSATAVYEINPATMTASLLYDLSPQLPESIISLDGLSDYVPVVTNKEECKKEGWKSVVRADGTPFKNQGDCIQYVNTGK